MKGLAFQQEKTFKNDSVWLMDDSDICTPTQSKEDDHRLKVRQVRKQLDFSDCIEGQASRPVSSIKRKLENVRLEPPSKRLREALPKLVCSLNSMSFTAEPTLNSQLAESSKRRLNHRDSPQASQQENNKRIKLAPPKRRDSPLKKVTSKPERVVEKKWKCITCNVLFTRKWTLQYHLKYNSPHKGQTDDPAKNVSKWRVVEESDEPLNEQVANDDVELTPIFELD